MLRLEKGEDVLPAIADFCKRKGILSASFRAIGAVEKAKIGYYDLPSKKYGSKEYRDAMEVASMTGNVAQVEEQGDALLLAVRPLPCRSLWHRTGNGKPPYRRACL